MAVTREPAAAAAAPTSRSSARSASIAAAVITLCFCVHATNGLLVERLFLGFRSYDDYADIDKLADALGSPPWLASGTAHLVTSVAVVVLGVNFAALMRSSRPQLAVYLRYATGVAAVGFAMLGVADVQGSQTVKLLADQNPSLHDSAYMTISIIVPVANGVAIAGFGVMMLIVARYARDGASGFPRWYAALSLASGLAGVLIAFAYIPIYLLLFLAWAWCTAVLLRHGGPISLRERLGETS